MMSSPLGYLDSAGSRAHAILPLTWFTLAISIAVCTIVAVLLWIAVSRAKPDGNPFDMRSVPLIHGGDGIRWIKIGLILSSIPLAATLIWTVLTLAAVAGSPAHPDLVLDVTARQWWWEVQYHGVDPADDFTTANEIHIPVGTRVLVKLHAADVIHSFWVPKLSGKTDAIPGVTNLSWLEADAPGRYLGACAEYCGYQHAHMGLEVVADDKSDFTQWQAAQRLEGAKPATPEQSRGLALIEYRCGLCHRVRGTLAGAINAPDLTHLMSRRMLAAGTIANNPANLIGWIENPQLIKPGSLMPNQDLSAQQLSDAVAFLETLR
jgi:cytochrome c oxidase subunit 2